MNVSALIFDADDTLWDEQKILQTFEKRIEEIFIDSCANISDFRKKFHAAEENNIPIIGYGFASYTYSFVEVVSSYGNYEAIRNVLLKEFRLLYDLVAHKKPIFFPHVHETVSALRERGYKLYVLTRGIPSEQKHKIDLSGIRDLFDGIHIVQKKTCGVYLDFCVNNSLKPSETVMIGNSLRSDILPAIDAGCHAIWIPAHSEWFHDKHEEATSYQYTKINKFSELLNIFTDRI